VSVSLSALHIRIDELDIEGTTTPVDFVYTVLFPFARTHVAAYLAREWDSRPCREAVELLRRERDQSGVVRDFSPATTADDFSPSVVVSFVHHLMDADRKSPGLKALQGLVWQDGYRAGELHGSVYPDVPRALRRWRAQGRDVYIYSSGSVLAQQLLFGSTEAGDLTPLLNGYFDTGVGAKQSAESYVTIASRIHAAPDDVLFLSDVVGELDAAAAAGMRTALCVRGAMPPNNSAHAVIGTFDEIEA
jgi:enolase-phosphatase E1